MYLSAPGAPSFEERDGGQQVTELPASSQLSMPPAVGEYVEGQVSLMRTQTLTPPPTLTTTLTPTLALHPLHPQVGRELMPKMALSPPPRVGDARVQFSEVSVPADGVSILALQQGRGVLRPWRPSNDPKAPSLYIMEAGHMSIGQVKPREGRDRDRHMCVGSGLGCGSKARVRVSTALLTIPQLDHPSPIQMLDPTGLKWRLDLTWLDLT